MSDGLDLRRQEIRIDSGADGPPLIITCDHRLTPAGIANLRASWEQAWTREAGPKMILLDRGMRVHQLIGGTWRALGDVAGAKPRAMPLRKYMPAILRGLARWLRDRP